MTNIDWQDIKTSPIGETILLCNADAGVTTVGYGEWHDKIPFPIFTACDPAGFGRFKPTHWAPMPEAATPSVKVAA